MAESKDGDISSLAILSPEHLFIGEPSSYPLFDPSTAPISQPNQATIFTSLYGQETQLNVLPNNRPSVPSVDHQGIAASSSLHFEHGLSIIPIQQYSETTYTNFTAGSNSHSAIAIPATPNFSGSGVTPDLPHLSDQVPIQSWLQQQISDVDPEQEFVHSCSKPSIQSWLPCDNTRADAIDAAPFDIFQALHWLFLRHEPQISLDALVESQSFVVTDAWQPDMPVIHVSEGFTILTGYCREDVIGKNCRFLQSPKGDVQPGSTRESVSCASAYELKEKIALGHEVQHVIKNFHKNGRPSMVLLTLIPIPWDASGVTRYWFGFQNSMLPAQTPLKISLRLGEQGSLLHRRKLKATIQDKRAAVDVGQQSTQESPSEGTVTTVSRPDPLLPQPNQEFGNVHDLLDASWRATDLEQRNELFGTTAWNDMLLQNIDGLVQVLSLKGTIVYISLSAKEVGYNSALLLGMPIETIFHPSDALAVRRELKNTSSSTTIDMAIRIRHIDGQHIWYNFYGSIWSGGTRKWAILVGRQLDMFSLNEGTLHQTGGFGDRDIWMKLSTSGLILSVFPNPQQALGMSVEELIGTSFQELIATDHAPDRFQLLLDGAQRGNVASSTAVLQSARGHQLSIELTLHPGKRHGHQRPYYLLAQCSFAKLKVARRKGLYLLFRYYVRAMKLT